MTQHTKGPWAFQTYDHSESGEDNHRNRLHLPEKYKQIVMNGSGCAFVTGDNQEANACLIAAAPELLEALETIQKYGYEMPEHEMVKKAIAKARGE